MHNKKRRMSARAARRKRQRRRQLRLRIMIFLGVIALVSLFIGLLVSHSNDKLKIVEGVWVYDAYTKYEFDGEGKGCMYLEDWHYEYTYAVADDKLKLDFEDDAVHDCTYLYMIEEDTLTIEGQDGTTGGTYVLQKQN